MNGFHQNERDRALSLKGLFWGVLFSLILWSIILFALSSCTPPPVPKPVIPGIPATMRSAEDTLQRNPIAAFAVKLADIRAASVVEEWAPPTPCRTESQRYAGNAIHVSAHHVCRVGKQFQAVFQRRFTARNRTEPSWLLVSLSKPQLPVNLTSLGWTGCWLQVNTDPRTLTAMVPAEGSILYPQNGRLVLDWTPERNLVGFEFWLQQVWIDAEANPAGALLSSMLHVVVGS